MDNHTFGKPGDPSEFDKLTGLYTREAFCKYADEKIKNNPDVRFNVVISDFVNFKHFNERYGTEAGDLLLKRTGEMLQRIDPACLRPDLSPLFPDGKPMRRVHTCSSCLPPFGLMASALCRSKDKTITEFDNIIPCP